MERSLEQRVQELEIALSRSRTRGRILLLLAATTAAIGAQQSQQVPDVIRAHAIEIVDDHGVANIRLMTSEKPVTAAAGSLFAGSSPVNSSPSPIAEIQVGREVGNCVSIAANGAGAGLNVLANDLKQINGAIVSLRALSDEIGTGGTQARVEARATGSKPQESKSQSGQETCRIALQASLFNPKEDEAAIRRMSALDIDFGNTYQAPATPFVRASVEEAALAGTTSKTATVSTLIGPSYGVSASHLVKMSSGIASDNTREASLDIYDGHASILDKKDRVRATLGNCELVSPESGVKTTMPPNSLVLFNESGNVVERLPRQ